MDIQTAAPSPYLQPSLLIATFVLFGAAVGIAYFFGYGHGRKSAILDAINRQRAEDSSKRRRRRGTTRYEEPNDELARATFNPAPQPGWEERRPGEETEIIRSCRPDDMYSNIGRWTALNKR